MAGLAQTPLAQTPAALESAARRWRRYVDAGRRRDADEIAEKLIEALAPMISHHMRRWLRPGVDADDLRQAGRIAVIGALERYDPAAASFKTFVFTTIQGEMQKAATRTIAAGNIRQPTGVQDDRRRVRRARETLPADATPAEIAAAAGIPENRVRLVLATEHVVCETVPFGTSTEQARGLTGIVNPDQHPACAVDWTDAADARILLDQILPTLPTAEQDLLRRRFLSGGAETLEEIARSLRVSRQRVQQMERRALERLRALLEPVDESCPHTRGRGRRRRAVA